MSTLTSPVDIRADHLEIVQDILRTHLPAGFEVWVFGSRANWTTKDSSDLDLAVEGPSKLDYRIMGDLEVAFEESDLPYTVDVVDFNTVSQEFREIVEGQKVLLPTADGRAVMNSQWHQEMFAQVLAEPVRTGVYKKKEFHGSGVKIINMGELFAHPRLRDVEMRRVQLSDSEQYRFDVQVGDLLFARRSLVAEGAGKCCVVLQVAEPTGFESSIIRTRPDPTKVDHLFLYYYFNSPDGLHSLDTIRRQVAVAGITSKDLVQLTIPLPPLPEQRAIAHILGTLDDKIELNRRMNQTLEEMARAIFQDSFVDFGPVRAKLEGSDPYLPPDLWSLFPDRLVDSELGEIPEGWDVKSLDQLVHLNPREPMKKGTVAPYVDMAALPTTGSTPDTPVLREFTSGARFRNRDTLLARITPCLENGKTAFVQSLPEGTLGWGSTEFVVMRSIPPVPPEFTYLLARHPEFRTHAIQSMTGTSGRQRVQPEALAAYSLACPSLDTWPVFGSVVGHVFQSVTSNWNEIVTLTAQRDALLPKLVSGEVRLNKTNPLLEGIG